MAELRGRGLRIDLPGGWEGAVYARTPPAGAPVVAGGRELATLHAANFPLPPRRGDFGSGAVELMGTGHVLVVLFEYHPSAARTALFRHQGLPLPLNPDDFDPHALQRPLPGQAGLQRFFSHRDRAFCLYTVVGSFRLRARLVGLVNPVLAKLQIARRSD